MARHAYRKTVGENFSEGARVLWLKIDEKFGGSQSACAAELGVDAGLLNRWLYADRKPGLNWALTMQRKLGIDPTLWEKPARKGFVPPGGRPVVATGTEG